MRRTANSISCNNWPAQMVRTIVIAMLLLMATGCHSVPPPTYTPPGPFGAIPVVPNPLPVANLDRDFVWEQVVEVVSEYFKVDREQRPKLAGDILTEGRLDTFPQISATLLEPWRGDTVSSYDRLEATLQSMRRRAFVRVIPSESGFSIDVAVIKELEEVAVPEHSSAAGTLYRVDLSQQRLGEGSDRPDPIGVKVKPVGSQPKNALPATAWINKGRDPNLEQLILAKIERRVRATVPVAGPPFEPGLPIQIIPNH